MKHIVKSPSNKGKKKELKESSGVNIYEKLYKEKDKIEETKRQMK